MSLSKSELKKSPYFHLVDPMELDGLQEHAEWLNAILHNPCMVWEENGEYVLIEIKQLVAKVNGLKIEIYANEHPPPHFHVKSPNIDACFSIEDCKLINGTASPKDLNKIRFWHTHAKPLLIESWNATRPTSCTVGKYSGS